MTEAPTVSTAVHVCVDPATAFVAFTEEIDQWWVRGPINAFDSSRALAMRCEGGVGGRFIEVYDADSGEGLELGRITTWEPGERLSFTSSVDDVHIDVRFTATDDGTEVRVDATIPTGGREAGGTAWVRVTERWFAAWCTRRDRVSGPQPPLGRLGVLVNYASPGAAARWLSDAFGLASPSPLPTEADPLPRGDYGLPWIELRAGTCSIIIGELDSPVPPEQPATHEPWVYVDDLEAHLAHATTSGATILSPIRHTGFRAYTAADLEGRRWTFLQANPAQ